MAIGCQRHISNFISQIIFCSAFRNVRPSKYAAAILRKNTSNIDLNFLQKYLMNIFYFYLKKTGNVNVILVRNLLTYKKSYHGNVYDRFELEFKIENR